MREDLRVRVPLTLPDAIPPALVHYFYPSVTAFYALSVTWPARATIALVRVVQHRFVEHEQWMIRCYSLTFAAVTAQLWAPILFSLSQDPYVFANGGIVLWPINLVFAEWLIRRKTAPFF